MENTGGNRMKSFIQEIGKLLDFPRLDLIEKDIRLHNLLLSLSKDEYFSKNFSFKGGTCLIKSYLGYYRFSEDIDFTWRKQEVFDGMSQKRIRKYLSEVIDRTGGIFEDLGEAQGFEFINNKNNDRYVELGGSNKTATFKLWYNSEILDHPLFIKVQFNFVELLKFPQVDNKLHSLLSDQQSEELKKFFPIDYENYSKTIEFETYDIREIICEKVRSILTRRGTKARDFLDIYLIAKTYDENVLEYKPQIIDKTRFILDMYEKYRLNLKGKIDLVKSKEIFEWGGEKELLLKEINEIEFGRFNREFSDFLIDVIRDLV
jgi:predicted nucleotidyltransferase component of viral defense system